MTDARVEQDRTTNRPGGVPLGYMPQLDGLRAAAVLGVWFEHWGIVLEPGFRRVEWGKLAVWLFFVLSGFLITGILLRSKREVETGGQSVGRAAKVFYLRRFLRILPIYYLTLAATALAFSQVRRVFWWHLTYTTDFWVQRHPDQFIAGIHFWTLAVEEQFYLIWPWIVLLLPRRQLVRVMIGIVVGSVAYRAAIQFGGVSHLAGAALPHPVLGNIDKFAIGGMLALFRAGNGEARASGETTLRTLGLTVGLPVVAAFEYARWKYPQSLWVPAWAAAFMSTAAGLFFAWLVAGASAGFKGPLGWLLALRPVRFVGKISYGIYLFHMFTPGILQRAHAPLPPPHRVWARFFVYAIATVLAGTASWYLIESPLNSLKRKYRYTKDAEQAGEQCPQLKSAFSNPPSP